MAVSELVDPPEKRMKFGMEEVESEDGKWYRALTSKVDTIGSIKDLRVRNNDPVQDMARKSAVKARSAKFLRAIQPQSSKVVSIEEIEDESESEDDDLPTYEKPDSDEEDEDEDPTLIQRNKPTAPVYIRDLLSGLKDTENYDRNYLAVSTAADLIRRKANFGTEVSDHVEELATKLIGLSDTFNIDKFEEMRLQAMIAVVVAKPLQMGKWFSNTVFNGDYSMSQRASILTALSMAARDLAGYRQEDAALTGAYTDPKDLFPSKRLPSKMAKAFTIETAPINALTEKLERTMIKPMAVAAADQLSGPNALKVRTFSSRMEVEKKRKRPITNELAKVVSDGFLFPLTGLYRVHMQA